MQQNEQTYDIKATVMFTNEATALISICELLHSQIALRG